MKTYLVGGAVRDALLGIPVKERDFVVIGTTPQEMLKKGFKQVGKDFPVFLHPDTKEEYALARTERKTGPGYKGFQFYAAPEVTLEEDLQRRDLTINAIAQSESGEIIDPFGGQKDLQQRLLRHVSEAFIEDPVRVLRVARFAARFKKFGFQIAPETLHLMRHMVENREIDALVPERTWQEFYKALTEDHPEVFFETLHSINALARILPEFSNLYMRNTPKLSDDGLNYAAFSLKCLQNAVLNSREPIIRFASVMLYIPYGKDIQASPNPALMKSAFSELQRRLRAPTDMITLSQLACLARLILPKTNATPEMILNFFEKMDAFRRPERFFLILEVIKIHLQTAQLEFKNHNQLITMATACRDLKIQPTTQQTGPEIAEHIRKERLDKIRLLLV